MLNESELDYVENLANECNATEFCNQDEYLCIYWEISGYDFRVKVSYETEDYNDDGIETLELLRYDYNTRKHETIETIKNPSLDDFDKLCNMAKDMF